MKRKTELVILSIFGLLGLVLAMTTNHLPELAFKLDYLIDLSSLLTVASFSVRGMLPLRVLAVASGVIAIPYFVLQPTPLWTPAGWTALFLAINSYHIIRILLERRPVKFTPDEQRLYDLAFKTFGQRDFLKLLQLGEWETAKRGDKILSMGERISQIAVPISGAVAARLGEQEIAKLNPGELIGAGVALTEQGSAFDAEFVEDGQYMRWSVAAIDEFLGKDPELALEFNNILNRYLVGQINNLSLCLGASGDR